MADINPSSHSNATGIIRGGYLTNITYINADGRRVVIHSGHDRSNITSLINEIGDNVSSDQPEGPIHGRSTAGDSSHGGIVFAGDYRTVSSLGPSTWLKEQRITILCTVLGAVFLLAVYCLFYLRARRRIIALDLAAQQDLESNQPPQERDGATELAAIPSTLPPTHLHTNTRPLISTRPVVTKEEGASDRLSNYTSTNLPPPTYFDSPYGDLDLYPRQISSMQQPFYPPPQHSRIW